MVSLFFSYSHKDEVLCDELRVHLKMLERNGVISSWHDRRIAAGDEFDKSIDGHMEEAGVILLLVSPDFLASDYCYDIEMKRAMERHEAKSARVIPVILRPSDWKTAPFGRLLATPTDGKAVTMWANKDEAFLDVTRMIRQAVGSQPSPNPVDPVSTTAPTSNSLRSSNLAVTKVFTDVDKDRFLRDAFKYMMRYFENSLKELEARHEEIDTSFTQVDAHSFTAKIYRDGKTISGCAIQFGQGRGFGGGITYGQEISRGSSQSFYESLNIEVGDQSLGLKPNGMSMIMTGRQQDRTALTFEGASELYWSMLMDATQRKQG